LGGNNEQRIIKEEQRGIMSETRNTIVETKAGKIEGSHENETYVFKGIPYATPPVGRLRWMSPEPHQPWESIRQAFAFNTVAPQNKSPFDVLEGLRVDEPQSEDCLFLNIWSPGIDSSKRPVLVWIHGGAFCLGSGSQPAYKGSTLAKRGDAVVVTINYRRALPVKRLLSIQEEIRAKRKDLTPVSPVIDGNVIPERPIDSIKSGSAAKIPVLAGTNLEEWKLFTIVEPVLQKLNEAGLVKTLQQLVPAEYGEFLIDTYRKARAERGLSTSPLELLSAIQTDLMFRVPAIRVVEAQCQKHQSAYDYLFTWKSPVMGGILGACHVMEIGFVFGNHDDQFCGAGPLADKLATQMQDAWLSFARTGDPSCESLGSWPQYGQNRKTMILGEECHIEEAPYEEERHIWDIIGDVYPG
jgi:carboxylesterase type B